MTEETKKFVGTIQNSISSRALEGWEERGDCIFMNISASELPKACVSSITNGAVFDSAFISLQDSKSKGFTVRYLFRVVKSGKMLVLQSNGDEFSAISKDVDAAVWDERKMQDLTGVKLAGMADQRRIIFHAESGMPDKCPIGSSSIPKPKNTDYPMPGPGKKANSRWL